MFTGIIETLGKVKHVIQEQSNITFTMESSLATELKIDQSLAHNGVCLTVTHTDMQQHLYQVTAIAETLEKSNLGKLQIGQVVNLERAMLLPARLDGHLVQGHVDETGICTGIEDQNGSWLFTFKYKELSKNITIEKGSITVNGTSLTVVNSQENSFSVAIIPYTYENTNFHQMGVGDIVNLEFDLIGKYLQRLSENYLRK